MIVVDSSAVVDYLLDFEPQASWVAERLAEDPDAHAPHLLDVEILSTLRRQVLFEELSAARARGALDDLESFGVERYPHGPFLERAWELRENLTAGDALFVGLAEALGAPLVTTDARIARAAGIRARVVAFPA